MKSKIYVALAGGLGNQLFQVNCALNYFEGNVEVVTCLGNPRKTNGKADIEALAFPQRVRFLHCDKRHFFVKKIFSLLISMVDRRAYLNESRILRTLIIVATSIPLSIHLRARISPRIGQGIGFDPQFSKKSGNLFVGYFQSHLFSRNRKAMMEMQHICCNNPTRKYLEILEEVREKRPLLVHIRLGDYRLEKTFGVLETKYFEKSINYQLNFDPNSEIWLFSDEADLARKIVPQQYLQRIKVVDDTDLSPGETLMLMRNCANYVISNSTFSWWAAFLSMAERPKICYPVPWFVDKEDPIDLVPEEWRGFSRFGS